ncbi:hypothetical protein NT05LM_2677, partial [Listeria marthii FSL S4-120]
MSRWSEYSSLPQASIVIPLSLNFSDAAIASSIFFT